MTTEPTDQAAARRRDGEELARVIGDLWDRSDDLSGWDRSFVRGLQDHYLKTQRAPSLSAKQVGALRRLTDRLGIPAANFSGVDFSLHWYRQTTRERS